MATGARVAGLPGELPVMASLVDAGLRNLNVGDADAKGYFAMRVGIWDNGPYAGFPDHPALQLQWFIDQATAIKRQRIAQGQADFGTDPNTWGEWIADVQRPAEQFRGRYQLKLDEARELIADGCAAAAAAPPVVTVSADPAVPRGQGGFVNAADLAGHGGVVTVTVSAADASGVAALACTDNGAEVAVVGQSGANPRTGSFTLATDGAHAVACQATDALGHAGAGLGSQDAITVNIDATLPAVGYTGNAGTYLVDAGVDIACDASDALSGLDAAATSCAAITGPAYQFAVGTNTFSASATDVAGNHASASTSFTVRATAGSLCALTSRFVRGSARYQALPAARRAAVDRLATALCTTLSSVEPGLRPVQRAALVRAFQGGISALAADGWLTPSQAATLRDLATRL